MAPRSARKRKANEGDASAPSRRKKREDTPMKIGGGASDVRPPASGDVGASANLSLTSSVPERQAEEASKTQLRMHLSFDPEDSQAMGSLDDSPSAEDLFPLMLETQYEGDEDAEEQEGEEVPAPTGEEYTAYEAVEEGAEGFTMNEEAKDEEGGVEDCLGGEDQGSQDGQDDDAEDAMRDSLDGASASIEEILQQLTKVAQNFMTNFRELTVEGEAIQAELNQLNEVQNARCVKMLGRLERAGNSIFSFGQPQQGNDAISAMETQTAMADSQEMAV